MPSASGPPGTLPPRIVLVSGIHLCRNPRVIKEAMALSRAGYEVEILGGTYDSELRALDQELLAGSSIRYTPVVDFANARVTERVRIFANRAKAKAGNLVRRYSGIESIWQFGGRPAALLAAARRARGDLYLVHLESAMVAACGLLDDGRRVGIDMEDWYSEDLLPEARQYRPIRLLRNLEQDLLRRCVHSTCPSRAMSVALAAEFECRAPLVIYNAFPWSDRQELDARTIDRRDLDSRSIHWFSQTIGPGRGLEDLFAALPLLRGTFELHLRGAPVADLEAWLNTIVPAGHRTSVHCHGLVPNRELISRIAEHDIGFAGEMKYCRNKDLTVSNKLLQYLLAGIAVVASDTAGQSEVAKQAPEAVHLYESGRPVSLAAQLNRLLGSPSLLARSKAAALQSAERNFCWERQEQVFLESIASALSSGVRIAAPDGPRT